jgi:hypothetical protein
VANGLYAKFKQGCLDKRDDLNTDSIKAILGDSADYTVNLSTHDFLDDVAAAAREEISGALGSPTITDGVFDTPDFTFTAADGDPCEFLLLYNDTPSTEATKGLIVYYDTGITGMPVDPNGGDINVTVNASGWFAL